MGAVGEVSVTFSGSVSEKVIRDKFNEFFVLSGSLELINHKGEKLILDVHEISNLVLDSDEL